MHTADIYVYTRQSNYFKTQKLKIEKGVDFEKDGN